MFIPKFGTAIKNGKKKKFKKNLQRNSPKIKIKKKRHQSNKTLSIHIRTLVFRYLVTRSASFFFILLFLLLFFFISFFLSFSLLMLLLLLCSTFYFFILLLFSTFALETVVQTCMSYSINIHIYTYMYIYCIFNRACLFHRFNFF